MGRPKYTPMQRQIRQDEDRANDRVQYASRMQRLRADTLAYKEWKAKKAAYMKEYRAKRDAKDAELRSGDAVQQVQPPEDGAGVLPEVPLPGVPGQA